jgi:hypothetical protein
MNTKQENTTETIVNSVFDLKHYEKLLKTGGTFVFTKPTCNGIYIEKVHSYQKGNGFGTAVMRHAVETAFAAGGDVTLEAAYSSHLFHLYMGMIPKDRQIDYVQHTYGLNGVGSLDYLTSCENVEQLENNKDDCETLIEILSRELGVEEDNLKPADVIAHRDLLLGLKSKSCSYLTDDFVPQFLDILEKNIGNKYPDTTRFSSVQMQLSQEGKTRWQEAIDKKTQFSPFKDFKQLLPFMTALQKEKLNSILIKNAAIVSKTTTPEILITPTNMSFHDSSQQTKQFFEDKPQIKEIPANYQEKETPSKGNQPPSEIETMPISPDGEQRERATVQKGSTLVLQKFNAEERLKNQFFQAYNAKLLADKRAWCGIYSFFAKSYVNKNMSLKELVSHAQGLSKQGSGSRSLTVMKGTALGWLDENNQVTDEIRKYCI